MKKFDFQVTLDFVLEINLLIYFVKRFDLFFFLALNQNQIKYVTTSHPLPIYQFSLWTGEVTLISCCLDRIWIQTLLSWLRMGKIWWNNSSLFRLLGSFFFDFEKIQVQEWFDAFVTTIEKNKFIKIR